jgi:hypothetical protein
VALIEDLMIDHTKAEALMKAERMVMRVTDMWARRRLWKGPMMKDHTPEVVDVEPDGIAWVDTCNGLGAWRKIHVPFFVLHVMMHTPYNSLENRYNAL